jgi:putative nucleotidyltransferase with HDIG domain
MDTLDKLLDDEEISSSHQDDIRAYLRILKNRHEPTYAHSVRVGILASQIALCAAKPRISARMLLWAGLLHDIGKSLVCTSILSKKEKFTKDDYDEIEPHVKYGCNMLSDVHDYTAHILARHHQFGPNPYPKELPPLPEHIPVDVVNCAARYLALADYYDALKYRDNDKNGSAPLSSDEKRTIFYRDNADQKDLIELLESAGIFKF